MTDRIDVSNEDWFVLKTRSRFEKKISEDLTKRGIDHYLPLKTERKKWSDRWKNVESPLFSGYVFVKMEEVNRYLILNLQGSVRFLYHDGDYAKLTRRDVQMMETALSGAHELEIIDSTLYKGKTMKITSGPFKNFEAKLVHHNGKGKLMLEVLSIAQGVLLEIGNTKIVPIEKSKLATE
jgi:transcriptional antiterminator NusG